MKMEAQQVDLTQNLIDILEMTTDGVNQLRILEKNLKESFEDFDLNKTLEEVSENKKLSEYIENLDLQKQKEIFELMGTIKQIKFVIIKLSETIENEEQLDIVRQIELQLSKVKHMDIQ